MMLMDELSRLLYSRTLLHVAEVALPLGTSIYPKYTSAGTSVSGSL
jgi:hypothetical protein